MTTPVIRVMSFSAVIMNAGRVRALTDHLIRRRTSHCRSQAAAVDRSPPSRKSSSKRIATEAGLSGVRPLLGQVLRWRGGLGWYAVALLLPTLLTLVGSVACRANSICESNGRTPSSLALQQTLLPQWTGAERAPSYSRATQRPTRTTLAASTTLTIWNSLADYRAYELLLLRIEIHEQIIQAFRKGWMCEGGAS